MVLNYKTQNQKQNLPPPQKKPQKKQTSKQKTNCFKVSSGLYTAVISCKN